MDKKQKGYFITLEGPDGSGKDSSAKFLYEFLKKNKINGRKIKVLLTCEPGGTEIGAKIRKIIIDKNSAKIDPLTELLLFVADRNQNIEEKIRPALENGYVVISNRHRDSSVSYQGAARKIGKELVEKLNNIVCKNIKPDLTIILDVDSKVGLSRVFGDKTRKYCKGKGDRIEQESLKFHNKVRKEYLKMSKMEKRFVVINTTKLSIKEVNDKIQNIVLEKLRNKK